MTKEEQVQLFESKQVRTVWDDELGKWYFSVVDVCAVLSESKNPQTYWRVLKKRLIDEGNQTVTNCNGFKIQSATNKIMKIDNDGPSNMKSRSPELNSNWGTVCTPIRKKGRNEFMK